MEEQTALVSDKNDDAIMRCYHRSEMYGNIGPGLCGAERGREGQMDSRRRQEGST